VRLIAQQRGRVKRKEKGEGRREKGERRREK
jgi:hypothetical protein